MGKKSYQFTVDEGDVVRMPNGTIGVVNHWDITCGGNVKEVRVFPLTNWLHRFMLVLSNKTWFYDREINSLTPLVKSAR